MKKFYSLIAAVAMVSTASAQLYSTGFESGSPASTGFVAGNVYNNTTPATTGPTTGSDAGKRWVTYYGTPSTTGAITGNQSMQMRWYTSDPTNLGYTSTNFGTDNVKFVSFKALNTNGLNVSVSYSKDGGTTWLSPQTFTLGTSALTYFYDVPSTETETTNLRFRFQIVLGATTPTATSRVTLDDVTFSSTTLAVVDATKAKANLVKNTIVSNELIFGAAAKVSVYNTAGQVVKTAEVAENSRLDVSALPKGTYVVTGLVNGQAVSQKIIKK